MADLLFATPWWLPLAIAVAGIAMFVSGNARQELRLRNGGAAVLGLAVLLVVVSYLVNTDVEKVTDRTNAMVSAIDRADWPAFETLLDERTTLAGYSGRGELADGAKASAQKFGLKNVRITSRDVRQDDTLITVTIGALSVQDMPPYPLQSTWQFDWQQRGDDWLLYKITPLSIGQQPGASINSQLPAVGKRP